MLFSVRLERKFSLVMGPPFRAIVVLFQSHVSIGFLRHAQGRETARPALEKSLRQIGAIVQKPPLTFGP